MDASKQNRESGVDPVEREAFARGHTYATLPALRQYAACRDSGNMEAAHRIAGNLQDFFSEEERTDEADNE